jgi:hypothetical protein
MRTAKKERVAIWTAGVMLLGISGSYASDGRADQPGEAEGRTLNGAYGFSLTQSCVRTPFQTPPAAGFDPVTHQLLVDGEVINSAGLGVLRFLREGQVTVEDGSLAELTTSAVLPGQTPVSTPTKFVCTGTHAQAGGGKLTVSLSCTVLGTPPGQTVTLNPLNFAGFVNRDRQSINLTSAQNEVHTVTISAGGTVVRQRERICLQSMKLDKLQ